MFVSRMEQVSSHKYRVFGKQQLKTTQERVIVHCKTKQQEQ